MSVTDELRHGEDGFTLVELLTAISISLIVLLATLQSLDLFTSNAAQQTRVTDANDQVRMTMDRLTRDMRGAAAIVRATPTDLVYTVPETAGIRTERLCVDSKTLRGTSGVAAAAAIPAPACTGTRLATLRSATETPFTYDSTATPADPALVRNVGLSLSLDASGGGKTASSTLSASVARRSAGILNLTDDDLRATCNSSGALLDVSATIPNVGSTLKVTYSTDGGVSFQTPITGGNTFQAPRGVTRVLARVTNAAGVTKIIRRDVECGDTP
jgi:prepilin-type N-terminal cleavage/methylation domain-containing protein